MKALARFLFLFLCFLCIATLHAQKPALGISDLNRWNPSDRICLSGDGKFLVTPMPLQDGSGRKLLSSTETDWNVTVKVKGWSFGFDGTGRYFISINAGDSLVLMNLKGRQSRYLPNVANFELCGKLLLFRRIKGGVCLMDLSTGRLREFGDSHEVLFSKEHRKLIIHRRQMGTDSIFVQALEDTSGKLIYSGATIVELAPTDQGGIVFTDAQNGLWYYNGHFAQAYRLTDFFPKGTLLHPDIVESTDRNYLYLTLQVPKMATARLSANVGVDVWSYGDTLVQSAQILRNVEGNGMQKKVILDLSRRTITTELEAGEVIMGEGGDYLLTRKNNEGDFHELGWNSGLISKLSLVQKSTGKRTELPEEVQGNATLSPKGNFVLYYLPKSKNYFIYHITSGKAENITEGVATTWIDPRYDRPDPQAIISPSVLWMEDESAVLLHDFYDYWKVDPLGLKPATNLMSGYGKLNNTTFYPIDPNQKYILLKNGQKMLLSSFNHSTKHNGFYQLDLGSNGKLKKLTDGPYLYYVPHAKWVNSGFMPVKAVNSEVYVIRRASAGSFPNFFVTKDFRNFRQITHHAPQKNFNWLTTELIELTTRNGEKFHSLLYKPENFDPKRKYPVIIYYYEKLSGNLHEFPFPELSKGALNIPYFVSNGYIVATPDINYRTGFPGKSALESIDVLADHLCGSTYVDSTKIGLQGHSFGGYETNYIAANSRRFAAACAVAGHSDLVSGYNQILASGGTAQSQFYEIGQTRMGRPLWGAIDCYISQSPIFQVDRISMPMLIGANKGDMAVPFEQGVQLFLGLRRLGKPAWLLQYDKQGHVLLSQETQRDFTIRMKQFFDHYLKGAHAPKWMLDGIPAKLKGIDDGLELDTTGRKPGPGLPKTN